jgi:hypothetical protein
MGWTRIGGDVLMTHRVERRKDEIFQREDHVPYPPVYVDKFSPHIFNI